VLGFHHYGRYLTWRRIGVRRAGRR
jgi:hypothetical protein